MYATIAAACRVVSECGGTRLDINPLRKPATVCASGSRMERSSYASSAVTVEPSDSLTWLPARPANVGPAPDPPFVV